MKPNCLENNKTLKNGLTAEQVKKAKAVLRKANISEICKKLSVNISTVHNVLRDQSPRVEDLNRVLIEAKKQQKLKEKAVKEFPL